MKLVFIITLSIALSQGRDGGNLEAARSFFEAVYDPVVEYDDQGRVLKEILKHQNIDENFLPIREIRAKIGDAKNKL